MQIRINGEEQSIHQGTTVAQLLEDHGLAKSPCAVEINRVLVPKRRHYEHALCEGDTIEIVTLVGGG
jgi:sulfur carrier protein